MKVSLAVAQKARAEDLKKSFSVFGHFYDRLFDDQFLPCREILEISRKYKRKYKPPIK